jgi:hypothetical protein
MLENFDGFNILFWAISIIVFCILVIYFYKSKTSAPKKDKKMDLEEIFEKIDAAGYNYDPYQDIFYTKIDAWQREMGYSRLYDEAAAPLSMIIDCEPIYFEYDGKRWMIEFWKGQYGMNTGCEVGVYTTDGPDLNIPGVFNGTFYNCASDEDLLELSYSLYKNGKTLFEGKDKHWWLTGFYLGEFSEPSELIMHLEITLKDEIMRNAFVEGLRNAGYEDDKISIKDKRVSIIFDEPKTSQPITRIAETDRITQRKNKLLCDTYRELTSDYDEFPEKIMAVQEMSPEIFYNILNIGKVKELFSSFEDIRKYLYK